MILTGGYTTPALVTEYSGLDIDPMNVVTRWLLVKVPSTKPNQRVATTDLWEMAPCVWLLFCRRLPGKSVIIGVHCPKYHQCQNYNIQDLTKYCGFSYHVIYEQFKGVDCCWRCWRWTGTGKLRTAWLWPNWRHLVFCHFPSRCHLIFYHLP